MLPLFFSGLLSYLVGMKRRTSRCVTCKRDNSDNAHFVVPRLSEEKRRDAVSSFPWRVVSGAWFRIFSRYLVPLTPPTVFVRSFWNLTGAFKMVWRYACVFFQNPEIIFYHFLHILNLDIFRVLILQKSIGCRYLVPLTPPTVFGRSFWNFTDALRMVWRYACGFFRILKLFFITFSAFLT